MTGTAAGGGGARALGDSLLLWGEDTHTELDRASTRFWLWFSGRARFIAVMPRDMVTTARNELVIVFLLVLSGVKCQNRHGQIKKY